MHYTGTIWRPPYESGSLLLEAAAGCTHTAASSARFTTSCPSASGSLPWRTLRRIWPRPRSCSGDSSYSGSFWWGQTPLRFRRSG